MMVQHPEGSHQRGCFFMTEVPDAPKQPTVKEVYHDSALISWEPPADGGKPITGYIVERKETKANRYKRHQTDGVMCIVSSSICKNRKYQFVYSLKVKDKLV